MARFKPCLNSSTIRRAPVMDKIQIAATAGYGAIEIWHDDVDAYLQEGGSLADMRRQLILEQTPSTLRFVAWISIPAARSLCRQ